MDPPNLFSFIFKKFDFTIKFVVLYRVKSKSKKIRLYHLYVIYLPSVNH